MYTFSQSKLTFNLKKQSYKQHKTTRSIKQSKITSKIIYDRDYVLNKIFNSQLTTKKRNTMGWLCSQKFFRFFSLRLTQIFLVTQEVKTENVFNPSIRFKKNYPLWMFLFFCFDCFFLFQRDFKTTMLNFFHYKRQKEIQKTHGMKFVPTATIAPKNQKSTKSNFKKRSKISFRQKLFVQRI